MVLMNNTHIFSLFSRLGFSFCLRTVGLNIHPLFSKKNIIIFVFYNWKSSQYSILMGVQE